MNDTIAAIATPSISGPIGIVRISGPNTKSILDQIFKPANKKLMSEQESRKMVLGTLYSRKNNIIDNCLAVLTCGPNTYTGEDLAEIQCHGSMAVLEETLKNIFSYDARMAQPGEFTKRAFLAGKIDLSGAEAIHDLIFAETIEVAQNAACQLSGVVGNKITEIRESIIDIIAHFHALVDFPDEEIDPFVYEKAEETLHIAAKELYKLAESYERGKIIRDGIDCTILGKPNVGKSSILNALIGRDKAIVTAIAGTTRDIIEEHIKAGPLVLKLSDTAGLRDTTNEVEKIGVERAIKSANNAKIVLVVFDGNTDINDDDLMAIARTHGKKTIAIINKSDLPRKICMEKVKCYFKNIVEVSAKDNENIEKITSKVLEVIGLEGICYNGEIITNARQAALITRAAERCEEAYFAAQSGMTPDAVTMDAEGAMAVLGEITGESITDDVVSRIFSNFCVGK